MWKTVISCWLVCRWSLVSLKNAKNMEMNTVEWGRRLIENFLRTVSECSGTFRKME